MALCAPYGRHTLIHAGSNANHPHLRRDTGRTTAAVRFRQPAKKPGTGPAMVRNSGSDGGAGGAPSYYQPIEVPTPTAASLPEFRPEETVALTSALSATRQFMPSAMPLLPMK